MAGPVPLRPLAIDDVLVAASSPVCSETEFHETVVSGDVSSMPKADSQSLRVVAGSALAFEPGGLHVMCLGVARPLVEGETVEMTLVFVEAGEVSTDIDIVRR